MGGNRQNFRPNPRKEKELLRQQQEQAMLEAQAAKEKQWNIIRICIAVLVFAAAVVLCVLMLKHDFNADRQPLLGTYVAEDRYSYATESGTDISGVRETFAITFYEDGRMLFKRQSGTGVHYFEYEDSGDGEYDGTIIRYTDGSLDDRIGVVYMENGDMILYCGVEDSVSFTVPQLVSCFGEDRTRDMMAGLYDAEVCSLLIAGDYDSITEDQLKAIGTEREKLPTLAFSIKDVPMIITLSKVADIPITRDDALAIWNGKDGVSDSDTPSDSDTISESDIETDDESDA